MRRPSEVPERLGRNHLPMTVNPPDETLRAALRRLGDQGRRPRHSLTARLRT